MLNDREKLIELLRDAAFKSQDLCLSYGNWCDGCPYINEDAQGCRFAIMVDHLIANGVTVQKKGEWKWEYIVTHGVAEKKAVCSLCGVPNKQYKPPYCPHCGAKMDGDSE